MASKQQILRLLHEDEKKKRAEIQERYRDQRIAVRQEIEDLDTKFSKDFERTLPRLVKDQPIVVVGQHGSLLDFCDTPPTGRWYGRSMVVVRSKHAPYKDALRKQKAVKEGEEKELEALDTKVSTIRRRITLYGINPELIAMIESL